MSKEDFYDLTPDDVLNAVDSAGFKPTGEFSQLNSYENRVFDVWLENNKRVIAKFYRPGRWSKNTILEEHEFLNDLKSNELPAVSPLRLKNDETLALSKNIWFALWPRAIGRMVDELDLSDLKKLGRTLARFHNIGQQKKSMHRPIMTAEIYGWRNLDILENWIAPEVRNRYLNAAEDIFSFLDEYLEPQKFIRIHGDCHRGNILKTDSRNSVTSEFFFIDFDDFCMGPPVQDFWMLLQNDESAAEGRQEVETLLAGYEEFRKFDRDDLKLIPALRGLRIVHYAAWIAKRWEDPSFPRLFPQYKEFNYWASEAEALEAISRSL